MSVVSVFLVIMGNCTWCDMLLTIITIDHLSSSSWTPPPWPFPYPLSPNLLLSLYLRLFSLGSHELNDHEWLFSTLVGSCDSKGTASRKKWYVSSGDLIVGVANHIQSSLWKLWHSVPKKTSTINLFHHSCISFISAMIGKSPYFRRKFIEFGIKLE